MVTLRESCPEDGDRVLEIWRDAVDATHDFLSKEDREAIEVEVLEFLPQAPLWVAVDDEDLPIGFMLLNGAHIEALFIAPQQHGKGLGRELVRHGLNLHQNLTTDVNEQNSQAIRFYEHLGFVRTGRSQVDGQGRPYPLIHLRYSGLR